LVSHHGGRDSSLGEQWYLHTLRFTTRKEVDQLEVCVSCEVSDWSIQKFKARLVIRGDHQVEGLNYNETFVLFTKMTSVSCFL